MSRILIVDDERQIRRIMRVALETQGYTVAAARTGEDAIEQLQKDSFDLVLLDLNMPGMGGMETCRTIRAESDVAIVVLSVRSSEKDKVEALDAGADDYVVKPFGESELMARIRAALRRAPAVTGARQDLIVTDELEVNLAARRVTNQGREIRLTPKEFDLLQYLVTNPDVTIPHNKLLQAVWGPEYGAEIEYLRVFVNRLRKKIETDPANPRFIITEPWTGYRFQFAVRS
jgi:two-component system KDP operon response regulator KdpE